jgi:CBS domain-containing protein
MLTAQQVMHRKVVSVSSNATVEETIRLLRQLDISGAPVVDGDGMLVGIISDFALLGIVYEPEIRTAPVAELMTRDVLTVDEQTPLNEIADLFIRHRIRRVPVVRDGRLVGVVSRPDLLKHVLESVPQLQEPVEQASSAGGTAEF